MKALIAGGGIAGLATGIALRQAGLEVEVFERTPELTEIGAGLMIWPNGSRSLHSMGVEVKAQEVQHISLCTWHGRQLIDYPVATISERYGSGIAFVHRADLQAALAEAFGRQGLHLGVEVIGLSEDARCARVIVADDSAYTGDFVVGADGLRSVVRRQLLDDGDPVYLGSTIWRGIVAGDQTMLAPGTGVDWVGRGSEFIAFYLVGNRVYWAAVSKEPRGETAGPGGHKSDLLERFGDWAQPVPTLIAATEESAILRNDMYDRPPARHWCAGRVALVGDAAHPMTPNQGQGACQALEDAVALADSLRRAPDLSQAWDRYECRRLRRANRVVAMSRQATRGFQLENPVLCALRDGFARLITPRIVLRLLDATFAAAE